MRKNYNSQLIIIHISLNEGPICLRDKVTNWARLPLGGLLPFRPEYHRQDGQDRTDTGLAEAQGRIHQGTHPGVSHRHHHDHHDGDGGQTGMVGYAAGMTQQHGDADGDCHAHGAAGQHGKIGGADV